MERERELNSGERVGQRVLGRENGVEIVRREDGEGEREREFRSQV